MRSDVAQKIRAIDARQKQGKTRSYFDCHLLERQCNGEEITEAALAESLAILLRKRKPNQKLDVLDVLVDKDSDKYVKVLYLADRSSNAVERRLFRPGLLHKLASRRAKGYISDEIKIDFHEGMDVKNQVAQINMAADKKVFEARKDAMKKWEDQTDPPRNDHVYLKKASKTESGLKIGKKEFSFQESGGGFSHATNEVKLVVDSKNRRYVLKKMPNGNRARNEIGLMQRLRKNKKTRSHVVGFERAGIIGDDLYVVMPYMNGPDCSKLIEKMRLQEEKELSRVRGHGLLMSRGKHRLEERRNEIVRKYLGDKTFLCRMAAQSVGALSDEGVIQNDLKWENILYDSEFGARVTDLELAKLDTEELIQGYRLRDNPRLKAPEIVAAENRSLEKKDPGKFSLTPAADVWSLGIMFCELLLGVNPFDQDRTQWNSDIEERISKHDGVLDPAMFASLPDDVRESTEELLNSMLQPDPAKRPTIREVLKSPIFDMGDRSESDMKNRLANISSGRTWSSGGVQQRRHRKVGESKSRTLIGRRENKVNSSELKK